jgi:hypothetical protein
MKKKETQNALTVSGMTGKKSWWNRILIFQPDLFFTAGDTIVISVNTNAQNTSGTNTRSPFSAVFICGTDSDITRPSIISTHPENGQKGVSPQITISAEFSEKIAPWSAAAFSMNWDGVASTVGNTYLQNDWEIIFPPSAFLCYDRIFTALIDTSITDLCGNRMRKAYSWTFRIMADTVKPGVLSFNPVNGDSMVSVNTPITVKFSEPMDTASVRKAFTIDPTVTGKFYWSGDTLMNFTLTETLSLYRQYSVAVGISAEDQAGNPLTAAARWSFTTIKHEKKIQP